MTVTNGATGQMQSAGLARLVTDAFAGFAGGDGHPCLGARSVIRREAFDLHLYGRLGSLEAAAALNADLEAFGATVDAQGLTSLVAVFGEPAATSEEEFSALLWRQLQRMHDLDHGGHAWDGRVSADPADPHFSFSVAGTAYFIVGLHAGSSRWSRRFAWPTLVFNPHEQFMAMRESGRYDRMRSMIRGRDTELQGCANPVLRDHGKLSEARQYAGDAVPDSWDCPLHVHQGS